MTFIVEDGTGIYNATSYVGLGFIHSYLHARGLETTWDAATSIVQETAAIKATDYIDMRFRTRFLGSKEFLDIAVAESNNLDFLASPQNNSTITIGTTVYKFVNAIVDAYDVNIGVSVDESAANLILAILATGVAGTDYGVGTLEHPDVTAMSAGHDTVFIQAKVAGENGGIVSVTSDDGTRLSWDTATLTGGSDSEEQILEWPRLYVYSPSGTLITGIPTLLKRATAEYALRALSADLMPDPTIDDSGKSITRKKEQVGPIVEETEFASGISHLIRPYPSADRLLLPLLNAGGGVIR